jgi:Tetratricopeptide repeat
VATSLNNLALLYYGQGQYAKAEPLYQRSLAIAEKALGPEHPEVATSLNNLAALYRAQGQYAKAEPLESVKKSGVCECHRLEGCLLRSRSNVQTIDSASCSARRKPHGRPSDFSERRHGTERFA